MDCSPPGFSIHGISQARILEWVAISFSRGSSQPRDRTGLLYCRQILYHLKPRPKNKWWRRHIKSPSLTPHVRASLEPEAPVALLNLSEAGEGEALAGGAGGHVGVGRGSANSRSPLPRKGGQGPATSSSWSSTWTSLSVGGLVCACLQPALGQASPHWGLEDSRRRASARKWTWCHWYDIRM